MARLGPLVPRVARALLAATGVPAHLGRKVSQAWTVQLARTGLLVRPEPLALRALRALPELMARKALRATKALRRGPDLFSG